MKKFKLILLIITVVILYNCSNNEVNFNWEKTYTSFDQSKVDQTIQLEGSKVRFNPPLNWLKIESKFSNRDQRSFSRNEESEEFILNPNAIFFNNETNSLLTISTIKYAASGRADKLKYIQRFKNYRDEDLLYDYESDIIQVFSFHQIKLNGSDVIHLIENKPNLKSIKIICQLDESNLIQFDYTVRKQNFTSEKNSIISSIASIKYK